MTPLEELKVWLAEEETKSLPTATQTLFERLSGLKLIVGALEAALNAKDRKIEALTRNLGLATETERFAMQERLKAETKLKILTDAYTKIHHL